MILLLGAIFSSLIAMVIISLIVFGGGQVFMPIFQSFWLFIGKTFNLNITQKEIDLVFTISNFTPGVVSTKFSAFTGLLISDNSWWGILVSLICYILFCLPAIFMMILSTKLLKKSKQNKYLLNLTKYINPALSAIMLALSIQLLISTMFPNVIFNRSINNYFSWNNVKNNKKLLFFSNWRLIVLLIFVPTFSIFSFVWYQKKKPIYFLFIIGVILAFIAFQPWL
ncbi:chromate transporter [Mesomycoplasma neurolyticum]|uniref:Chromate transporter n=1 Tax=Mesomycoplasma neurolyticum TaxID=2120 RepID=A0A449A5N0_9BACT|nr:chromate transporter [Mesomycoplasma neurolyticum]VEU59546.1 Chromate transporter [Mesomycoplasma neurolyticum]